MWICITLLGAALLRGGEEAPLVEMVKNGIGWQFIAAVAFLVVVIYLHKWHDIGFRRPHSVVRVMWFPVFWLGLIAMVLFLVGIPTGRVFAFIALNTFLVGISEEVMFRGVLFRAFVTRYGVWTSIVSSSILFGAVHILNVFNTGDLGEAFMQSIPAGMSGILFIAIVIRTGSIWPAIIYHALWDCVLFLILTGSQTSAIDSSTDAVGALGTGQALLPIVMGLPSFICGLILLRNVRDSSFRAEEKQVRDNSQARD